MWTVPGWVASTEKEYRVQGEYKCCKIRQVGFASLIPCHVPGLYVLDRESQAVYFN